MTSYRLIDPHQHNGQWPFPGRFDSIEMNLYYMKRYHISAAIISSTEAIVSDMVGGNARLAGYIAGKPGLYGYVVVNPNDLRLSCQQMDRYYANQQFVAAKIHPAYAGQSISSSKMAPLIAEIAARGKPALIHTWGAAEVRALGALAQRHPQWRVLMAHGGGDAWRDALVVAKDTPNIYLEFCCSAVESQKVERAVEALGPDRICFGSDATLFDAGYMLAMYEEAALSPEARAKVMGGNALNLFGLE
jgi:predicted TIM-barrel fold metal-dependent hydrolase